MIETIVSFFEKVKKARLSSITISVKEKEQYIGLEKYLRQKILDYIDKNMIRLE